MGIYLRAAGLFPSDFVGSFTANMVALRLSENNSNENTHREHASNNA